MENLDLRRTGRTTRMLQRIINYLNNKEEETNIFVIIVTYSQVLYMKKILSDLAKKDGFEVDQRFLRNLYTNLTLKRTIDNINYIYYPIYFITTNRAKMILAGKRNCKIFVDHSVYETGEDLEYLIREEL